jgi:hypothetical protein
MSAKIAAAARARWAKVKAAGKKSLAGLVGTFANP